MGGGKDPGPIPGKLCSLSSTIGQKSLKILQNVAKIVLKFVVFLLCYELEVGTGVTAGRNSEG